MPSATSAARVYFEFIKTQADPFHFLSSMPDPAAPHYPFFEEEWIDFKGSPRDEKDAKRIWSKALSGFANITDGLIIWGIDARKMAPKNIDAASGLRLIPDPPTFESKLRDWLRDATNPPVMGVEFQSYRDTTGSGFVVCLIPESSHKPHRSEFADKHYYYRASDDFHMAEPGLLRVLFYPRFNPRFEIEACLNFEIIPNSFVVAKVRISYRLHNTGTATAKDVYVVINHNQGIGFRLGVKIGGNWKNVGSPIGDFAFESKSPIHPGSVSAILDIEQETQVWSKVPSRSNKELIPKFSAIEISFDLFADNYAESRIVSSIDCVELEHDKRNIVKRSTPNNTA